MSFKDWSGLAWIAVLAAMALSVRDVRQFVGAACLLVAFVVTAAFVLPWIAICVLIASMARIGDRFAGDLK